MQLVPEFFDCLLCFEELPVPLLDFINRHGSFDLFGFAAKAQSRKCFLIRTLELRDCADNGRGGVARDRLLQDASQFRVAVVDELLYLGLRAQLVDHV